MLANIFHVQSILIYKEVPILMLRFIIVCYVAVIVPVKTVALAT